MKTLKNEFYSVDIVHHGDEFVVEIYDAIGLMIEQEIFESESEAEDFADEFLANNDTL